MRLPNGAIPKKEETYGVLKFSALRREKMKTNDNGTVSDEVTERVYDMRCKAQGCLLSVGIPADVPLKDFKPGDEVELVNPVSGAMATPTFGNAAEVHWWTKADDIILRGKGQTSPQGGPSRSEPGKNDGK
ncbi:MAG: YdcP family protein [Ruminococcus sp.]|nr:YdcP family protein [Ruminococcus sp.]